MRTIRATVPSETVLQVPKIRPHRNPVQGTNSMWLLCAGTRHPGLPIEIRPERAKEMHDLPGRTLAWNHQCPTRREEIAKAKSAYEMRPRYHHVAEAVGQAVQLETTATIRRSRPSQTAAPVQTVQITRNRSQTGRGQKRTNTGTTVDLTDQENLPT